MKLAAKFSYKAYSFQLGTLRNNITFKIVTFCAPKKFYCGITPLSVRYIALVVMNSSPIVALNFPAFYFSFYYFNYTK